jgi:hypothetical protein
MKINHKTVSGKELSYHRVMKPVTIFAVECRGVRIGEIMSKPGDAWVYVNLETSRISVQYSNIASIEAAIKAESITYRYKK